MWWTNSLCTSAKEDLSTLAEYDPLTGYEPNDYHIAENTEPYIQESTGEKGSLNSHDLALFTTVHPKSEKTMRAVDEPITLKTKVCRPVSRRLSVIERSDPLWNSLTHKFQMSEKIRATAQKMSKSGFFWNDEESRFSLTVKRRFEKHEFQDDL